VGGGVVSSVLVWISLQRERPIELAPPNPFVSEFVFGHLDDGAPIGDAVSVGVKSGFYAILTIVPNSVPPDTLERRKVLVPSDWSYVLVMYPRGSSRDARDALCVPCANFERAGRSERLTGALHVATSVPIGNPAIWSGSGYEGPPEPPADLAEKSGLHLWTYFAVLSDQPAEYVYELTLYPTAAWRSSIRFETGPPVVLQRGLLKVTAAAS
jgi:hypothetical protein